MAQGGEPQQPAEPCFQLDAGETRADAFPSAWAKDHTDAALPSDLRQDLPEVRLLHVHGQLPVLDHDDLSFRGAPRACGLGVPPCLLGPGARARDEQEKSCRDADGPVSCTSALSIRHDMRS
jgi:hypothetical protein